jgi:hypothetical protein
METKLGDNPTGGKTKLNRGQRIILIVALICLLPLGAAVLMRFVWTPPTVPSLGELMTPQAFPYQALQTLDGKALEAADATKVADGWLMVYAAPGACDAACQQSLYLTRQSRTAQYKGVMRLDRLWVITDAATPAPELLAQHPDLKTVRLVTPQDAIVLGGIGSSPRYIHLVDRRGQLVMRYTDNPEPMKFIKEVGRLIKF